jgi:hypothetical protein
MVAHSECVFVALNTEHEECYIVTCDLARLYNIFPHYPIKDMIFEKTVLNIKYVLILYTCAMFGYNIPHSMQN